MLLKRFILIVILLSLALAGCSGAPQAKKSYTVGVMVEIPWLAAIFDSFKVHMAELGYVEGQNITYIYNPNAGPDQAAFDAEAQRLMQQKVDMFFTVGTLTTQAAKKAVEGTDIPVLFTPVINPVGEGVVADIRRPGGNVTGVQVVDQAAKGLEWLLKVVPGARHVYIPYSPVDVISLSIVEGLRQSTAQLGVEFLPSEVADFREMVSKVETLPENTVIYLIVPLPSLEPGVEDLGKLALERKIPLGTYNRVIGIAPFPIVDFSVDVSEEAKQGANMADRILKGVKPADMPVETAEYFLNIDLKQAKAFGVQVPDEILRQARTIVR